MVPGKIEEDRKSLFVAVLGLVVLWALFLSKVDDFDFWTHLYFGRDHLARWSLGDYLLKGWGEGASAWMFQVFSYTLFKMQGYELVSIVVAGVFAAALSLFLLLRHSRTLPVALLWCFLVLLSAKVAANRLLPRPEIVGYLLFGFSLLVASACLKQPRPRHFVLFGVILFFWYPLHQTVYLGVPFVLCVLLLFSQGGVFSPREGRRFMRLLLILAVTAGGVVFSARFAWFVLRELRAGGVLAGISEMRPTWEYPEILAEYLLLTGAASVLCWYTKGIRWRLFLLLVPVVVLGLVVERNVAFAAFAMLFICHLCLCEPGWREVVPRWRPPVVGALLLLNFVTVGWLAAGRANVWGVGLEQGIVPEAAARFVLEQGLPGPVFNNLDCGGYLLWAWQGQPAHFLDGRLGTPERLQEHAQILEAKRVGPLFDKYGIRTVLLQPAYWNSARLFPLLPMLMVHPDWTLVHASDGLVFVRDLPPGLSEVPGKQGWQAVLSLLELYAKVRPVPGHLEYSRGVALLGLGRFADAEGAFARGRAQSPELAVRYAAIMRSAQNRQN